MGLGECGLCWRYCHPTITHDIHSHYKWRLHLLERVDLNLAGQVALYLRETFTDVAYSPFLCEDNLACIAISESLVCWKFSDHIGICQCFVRELVLVGFFKLVPLCTNKIVADALTKSVPLPAFIRHRQIMTGEVPSAARLLRCAGG